MVFQKKIGMAALALSSLVIIAFASVPGSAPLKATLTAIDTLRFVGTTASASTVHSGEPSPAALPPRPNTQDQKAEEPEFDPPEIDSIQTTNGTKVEKVTNQTNLKIHVKGSPPDPKAQLRAFAGKDGTLEVGTLDPAKPLFEFNSFVNQEEQSIVVRWVKGVGKDEKQSKPSKPFPLKFDTIGPMVEMVRLVGCKGGDANLEIVFEQDDLKESEVKKKDSFQILRTGGLGTFIVAVENNVGTPALAPDRKTVLMKITEPITDSYQVEIKPQVVDLAGNPAGYRDGKLIREQKLQFSSYPERVKGEHVEFPDFVQRQKQAPGGFNPGDKVETRVVRLYYFRDAHRVAEIINRNVQSFNRAAVDQKRREAESSRQRADSATDDRRSKERQAVQAAQAARQAERNVELAEAAAARARTTANLAGANFQFAQTQLTSAQTTFNNAKTAKEKAEEAKNKLKDTDSDAAKEAANQKLTQAQNEFGQAQQEVERLKKVQTDASEANKVVQNDLREKEKELNDAHAKLETKRNSENANREEWLQSEAKEDRAKEDQFRKEVAAAHEDPDTYVAGKVNSIDPVTQVSISVIGEGLIQLRGPIRGINKIRTMIDQIDTPVGQVKVGIFTVQINGEHGDRMEKVAQRIEGNIDVSRFLTAQSMMLLRRAVQEIASDVAQEAERGGHYQVDRDRKYLYSFFGRDFIDELYAMDSEFLYSGNKILSLHSMDTVSRSNALFVMALAKNSVRQKILERYLYLIRCELPKAEYDFRKASNVLPCDRNTQREIMHKAKELYTFRSLRGMFDVPMVCEKEDVMTPMQREFIRLGQIFKSQMVAEIELKQGIVERGLIEDRARDDEDRERMLAPARSAALGNMATSYQQLVSSMQAIPESIAAMEKAFAAAEERFVEKRSDAEDLRRGTIPSSPKIQSMANGRQQADIVADLVEQPLNAAIAAVSESMQSSSDTVVQLQTLQVQAKEQIDNARTKFRKSVYEQEKANEIAWRLDLAISNGLQILESALGSPDAVQALVGDQQQKFQDEVTNRFEAPVIRVEDVRYLLGALDSFVQKLKEDDRVPKSAVNKLGQTLTQTTSDIDKLLGVEEAQAVLRDTRVLREKIADQIINNIDHEEEESKKLAKTIREHFVEFRDLTRRTKERLILLQAYQRLITKIEMAQGKGINLSDLLTTLDAAFKAADRNINAFESIDLAKDIANVTRQPLDHRKLLDFLVDEKEEKWIDLREGTKAHLATMDNYLKRLAIALEDDFKVQFHDPAFAEVRKAAREWDVNLGQVERTTILTNNRAFAKVTPQATMEFDLPKRDILIVEAMKGAKAMTQDFGALMQDPTFLAATKMLSGSPTSSASSAPKENLGGMANSGQSGPPVKNVLPAMPSSTEEQFMNQSGGGERELGSALEALIPDPAIYKFETGTGFEIRPVIQPDGDSVIYDFNYMYTTNVREPVRADEKHLGRVKRHFIDTQVQTSSYELREISRYQVALKASRTSRGVPLFEDIPALGVLFRPLPSAESSLQQNIILGQSVVYPTLFDLMGLRWAPHIVNLDHDSLRDEQHVVRGRAKTISDFVFEEASDRVDGFLGIKHDDAYKHLRRPDLYHRQNRPSPHHPSGYSVPYKTQNPVEDPTGNQFEIPDRRPVEMRDPPFDSKHRSPIMRDKMETLSESDAPRLILPTGKAADSKTTGSNEPGMRKELDATPFRPAPADSAVKPAQYERMQRNQPANNSRPVEPSSPGDSGSSIGNRLKRLLGR